MMVMMMTGDDRLSIGEEDTFIDLGCRVTGVLLRFSSEGKEVLSINNNQFSVDMSQEYNPRQTVRDVNVLVSNCGFNGRENTAKALNHLFLFIVNIRPGVIPTFMQLIQEAIELTNGDAIQSLIYMNETETPPFLTCCEDRKTKLIQLYGFSYHRHRVGCFCRNKELNDGMME